MVRSDNRHEASLLLLHQLHHGHHERDTPVCHQFRHFFLLLHHVDESRLVVLVNGSIAALAPPGRTLDDVDIHCLKHTLQVELVQANFKHMRNGALAGEDNDVAFVLIEVAVFSALDVVVNEEAHRLLIVSVPIYHRHGVQEVH